MKINLLPQFLCLLISTVAVASSGTGVYNLEWPNPSEVLEYHSCGMADACWVAELKNKTSGEIKLRLRCDGEKLYFTNGSKKTEVIYQNSCASFEGAEINSKSAAITQTMKTLSRE